jgi:hypothetical protein
MDRPGLCLPVTLDATLSSMLVSRLTAKRLLTDKTREREFLGYLVEFNTGVCLKCQVLSSRKESLIIP